MPSEGNRTEDQSVERLPNKRTDSITNELNEIRSMLVAACPDDAIITFDFDGRLHVHIDVHRLEDVMKVEGLLPSLRAGMFHDVTRGNTPHHPMSHRLSAIVDR